MGELDVISSEFAEVESLLAELKVQETELSANLQGIGGQITRCQEDIKLKVQAIADKDQERQEAARSPEATSEEVDPEDIGGPGWVERHEPVERREGQRERHPRKRRGGKARLPLAERGSR